MSRMTPESRHTRLDVTSGGGEEEEEEEEKKSDTVVVIADNSDRGTYRSKPKVQSTTD